MICEGLTESNRIFRNESYGTSLRLFLLLSKTEQSRARNYSKSDSGRSHVNKAKTSFSELDMYCPISDSTVVEFCTKLSSVRK